jgi:uncharacterized LabA/DUF88 family protein
MERVVCFVDGFNVYHALVSLWKQYNIQSNHLKWLDLNKLIENRLNVNQELVDIYFFTARPSFYKNTSNASKIDRYTAYTEALKYTGVKVVEGRFKDKDEWVYCKPCGEIKKRKSKEEKESDVNFACWLLRLAHEDGFDKAMILSQDTDLLPPIRHIKELFPDKKFGFMLPPHRLFPQAYKDEVRDGIDERIRIKTKHLENALLPAKIGGIIRPLEYTPPAIKI